MNLNNSSDLLDEINTCLIMARDIERTLREMWKRISPGEDLLEGLEEKPK